MRSLDRHKLAYELASKWKADGKLASAAQLAQSYPVELRAVGVMQALAFSMGKSDIGHNLLSSAIADWVLSKGSGAPLGSIQERGKRTPTELLSRLAGADQAAYLAADAEAIAFADTIKTISKALKKVQEAPAPGGARS